MQRQAKQKKNKGGRPRTHTQKKRLDAYHLHVRDGLTYREIEEMTGLSIATISRLVKEFEKAA